MPRFDRTGPNGEGPKTGRMQGKCGKNDASGDTTTVGNIFGRRRCRANNANHEGESRGPGKGRGRNRM